MSLKRRLFYALSTFTAVMAVSVIGYRILGGPDVSFLQALYMAVITLAGVGYGEIIDTTHNPALRVFNIFIVFFGVALTVYVFSTVTAFLVEGEIRNIFWRRRMARTISELKDHFIVCGLGDTGRYCIDELHQSNMAYVAVDSVAENISKFRENLKDHELLYVVGDAADANVLEEAGIARAKGLIAALPSDKDNLVITVMARQQNSNLRIVARCRDLKFADRLVKAGANATVSPNHIGGLRMASEAVRPHVVNFLDRMLKEKGQRVRVEEITIPDQCAWVGLSFVDVDLRGKYRLLPLALKVPGPGRDHEFIFNPSENEPLKVGSVIVVMGEVAEVHRARQDAHHNRITALRDS